MWADGSNMAWNLLVLYGKNKISARTGIILSKNPIHFPLMIIVVLKEHVLYPMVGDGIFSTYCNSVYVFWRSMTAIYSQCKSDERKEERQNSLVKIWLTA